MAHTRKLYLCTVIKRATKSQQICWSIQILQHPTESSISRERLPRAPHESAAICRRLNCNVRRHSMFVSSDQRIYKVAETQANDYLVSCTPRLLVRGLRLMDV